MDIFIVVIMLIVSFGLTGFFLQQGKVYQGVKRSEHDKPAQTEKNGGKEANMEGKEGGFTVLDAIFPVLATISWFITAGMVSYVHHPYVKTVNGDIISNVLTLSYNSPISYMCIGFGLFSLFFVFVRVVKIFKEIKSDNSSGFDVSGFSGGGF